MRERSIRSEINDGSQLPAQPAFNTAMSLDAKTQLETQLRAFFGAHTRKDQTSCVPSIFGCRSEWRACATARHRERGIGIGVCASAPTMLA
jgi:hypothetical protein